MRKKPANRSGPPAAAMPMLSIEARRRIRTVTFLILGLAAIAVGAFVIPRHYRETRSYRELAMADERARRGPVEAAIEEYERLATLYPGTPVADRALKEREHLNEYLRGAIDLKHRAEEAFKAERYEEALRHYRKIAEEYPLSLRAAMAQAEAPGCIALACRQVDGLARKAFDAGRWAEARELFARLIALDPKYAGADEGLQAANGKLQAFQSALDEGAKAEAAREWWRARRAYEQALAVIPGSTAAFDGRVRALQRLPAPEGMVLILPGETTVGAADGKPDEAPPRPFKTPGFYLDAAEVTNAQYARFVAATGAKPPPHWGADRPPEAIAGLPVVCVTWPEAAAYAAWTGKRLPTELEWERAARGRAGNRYPWGDTFSGAEGAFARRAVPADPATADKSEEGCLNMAGNVSEWTEEAGIPAPKLSGPVKPVRGASWAGVERDRPERVVPSAIATGRSDPARTVLIDRREAPGLEVRAFAETEFFFRGVTDTAAQIDIVRWLPDACRFVVAHTLIKPGEPITAEKTVPAGTDSDAPLLRVRLDTGCRLASVVTGEEPAGSRILYVDAAGKERSLTPTRRTESDFMRAADPMSEAARALDKIVREAAFRPFAQVARASNRLLAPPDGRYLNVGFRCAQELAE